MSAQSTKVFNYLKDKFNIPTSNSKIAQMLALYSKKENQQPIDKAMLLIYNETFSVIVTNSDSYKPKPKLEKTVAEIIAILKDKIRQLELEVKHLTEDKEGLRTNYWNLKESINKSKSKSKSKSNGVSVFNGV